MKEESELRILIIDDEYICSLQLSKYLKEVLSGVEIKTACNGEEGWEIIRTWEPDVVLSDINMPVMDGIKLLHQIRENHPATETIFFTAGSDIDAPVKAMKLGAADYLLKPLDGDEVVAAIMRVLSGREGRQADGEPARPVSTQERTDNKT